MKRRMIKVSENEKENIQELDSEKAYEILLKVFKKCNIQPPENCHKYFVKGDKDSDTGINHDGK